LGTPVLDRRPRSDFSNISRNHWKCMHCTHCTVLCVLCWRN